MSARWLGLTLRGVLVSLATPVTLSTGCTGSTEPVRPPVVEQPGPEPSPPAGPAAPDIEHIYLGTANGSVTRRLTAGSRPAWSPDGRRIAFHRDGEIHLIDADGSNEVRLLAGVAPDWSPDGTRIVFVGSDGISVMNVDGSGARTLIRHDFRDDTYEPWDMGVGKPAWSPDGAHIAFEHLGDGDVQPAQVYVMRSDGSTPRRLTTHPDGWRFAESDPSWSPDGSKVIHWSYGYGIAATDANGGVPTPIYSMFPAVAYGTKPVWSPDGRRIAYTSRHLASGREVWIMSLTGGGPQVLIPSAYDAAWSPDGRIAFVSNRRP